MINLRRSWFEDTKPPRELGITFDIYVPQTIGDQTWYFNCKNVPEELPEGYSILEGELESFIGYGLSRTEVEKLKQS